MKIESNKDRGRIGLSMAINYFSCQGYTVSVPLNDTQWYDLVIEKMEPFLLCNASVQVQKMALLNYNLAVALRERFMIQS